MSIFETTQCVGAPTKDVAAIELHMARRGNPDRIHADLHSRGRLERRTTRCQWSQIGARYHIFGASLCGQLTISFVLSFKRQRALAPTGIAERDNGEGGPCQPRSIYQRTELVRALTDACVSSIAWRAVSTKGSICCGHHPSPIPFSFI
jgi:hypothetical protein